MSETTEKPRHIIYSININQKAIFESGLPISLQDAVIIESIRNFFASGKATEINQDGVSYKWIAASKIASENPMLGMAAGAVIKRLRSLVDMEIIERCPSNKSLKQSFFRAGKNWDMLYGGDFYKKQPMPQNTLLRTDVHSQTASLRTDVHSQTGFTKDHDPEYYSIKEKDYYNNNLKEDGAKKPAPIPVEKIEIGEVVNSNSVDFDGIKKADSLEAASFEKEKKVAPKKEKEAPAGFDVFAKQYGDFYAAQTGLELDLKKAANEKGLLAIFSELKKSAKLKYPAAPDAEISARAAKGLQTIAANWGNLSPYLKQQIAPSKLAANLPQVIMALKPGGANGQKPTHHPSVLDNMTTEQLLNRKSIDQVVEERIAQRKKDADAAMELVRNSRTF